MAVVARELGVPDPPTSMGALRRQLADYRPELRSTRAARDGARYLLIEPPLPLAAYPGYLAIAGAAVSLMPRWTRWPLRLPLLPVSERLIATPAGTAVTGLIRWATAH
jgi:hypothetical protein